MNNRILRVAALEIAKDPDNVIKVATMLGKIKRWISSMFSPAVRTQIQEIDKKHMELKPLIDIVNSNMQEIESSIENVDLTSYDLQVNSLLTNITALNKKLLEMKGTIIETKKDISKDKTPPPKKGFRPGKEITKGSLHSEYIGKKLKDIELYPADILFTSKDSFYNSLASDKFGGYGAGGVSSLKRAGFDDNKIKHILKETKDNEIFDTVIKKELDNFEIKRIFERPTNDASKQFKCVLVVTGDSTFTIDVGTFIVHVMFFIGLLSVPTPMKKAKSLKIIAEEIQSIEAMSSKPESEKKIEDPENVEEKEEEIEKIENPVEKTKDVEDIEDVEDVEDVEKNSELEA